MKQFLICISCCLLAMGLSQNISAQDSFSDADWLSLNSGLDSYLYTVAVSSSNLYVGGYFTMAGGMSANNIAQWNGNAWSALGSGVSGLPRSRVTTLAVSGTNLYAGGHFTMAGGVPADCIAQWNGSSWSALGLGLASPGNVGGVGALAVSGSNLYAGGGFISSGSLSLSNVAMWNGNSWSALGSGVNGGAFALAVSGTNLYVGGPFTNAGAVSANYIAQWNGSSWSPLGSGMNSPVYALAVCGSNLYAGGLFTNAGGVPANYIAMWNGTTWSALGSGISSNGGPAIPVLSLAVSGTNLFVGGYFTNAGGISANYIAVWNGSSWSALGSGLNGGVDALALAGNNLFVGGDFTVAGTNSAIFVAEAVLAGPPVILTDDGNFGFTNGGATFGFDVSGNTGETLVVQASSNLTTWTSLQTNVLTNSVWYFNDPSAGSSAQQYYRAVLLP